MLKRLLLLDKNYVALSVIPIRKAIKLMVNGKAEPVDDGQITAKIQSSNNIFIVPSIIRLIIDIPWRAHTGNERFTRHNVLKRDNFLCQYCGEKVGKNATIDHVIPISRGGKTDYLNCVTSCGKCNSMKSDNTPIEAGMKLIARPRKPTFYSSHREFLEDAPSGWDCFIMGKTSGENGGF